MVAMRGVLVIPYLVQLSSGCDSGGVWTECTRDRPRRGACVLVWHVRVSAAAGVVCGSGRFQQVFLYGPLCVVSSLSRLVSVQ